MSIIANVFPEFIDIIGRKQHSIHDFTLDIHSLNVLQNVINNADYSKLNDEDKFLLKIIAIFHDIRKKANIIDKMHPQESAFFVYKSLHRLNMQETAKTKAYHIIKNHEWLKEFNYCKDNEKNQFVENIAFQHRYDNCFDMSCILTEADLKSVKRDCSFFNTYKTVLNKGKQKIYPIIKAIQASSILLPQSKIPNVDKIIIDNINTVKKSIKLRNGKTIENVYLYLKQDMNLHVYGFEKNLISKELCIIVHAIDSEQHAILSQTLEFVDTQIVLSASYINLNQKNVHLYRNNGLILYVDNDDIIAGYNKSIHSSFKKNLDGTLSSFVFNNSYYRKFIPNLIKKNLNLSDEKYIFLYNKIKNKSITEIKQNYPDIGANLEKTINEVFNSNKFTYNEILIRRPKIQALFHYGKEQIPEFLLEFAYKYKYPIIIKN